MSKFIERFKQVYRKPYPTAHYPENGSNGLLRAGWHCIRKLK